MKPYLKIVLVLLVLVTLTGIEFFSIVSESLFRTNTLPAGVEVVAHRGLHDEVPENTLEAVKLAVDSGIEFIEIDVHQTADGQLVVFHDFEVNNMTDGTGMINDLTWKEIQTLKIKYKEGDMIFRVPLLEEVIREVNGKAGITIELKAGNSFYPGIERKLAGLIRKYDALSWIDVHSFNDEALQNLHHLLPDIRLTKLLVCYLPHLNLIIDEGIHFGSPENYSYVSGFAVGYFFANDDFIEHLHAMNKAVHVWNLSDKNITNNLAASGVDRVISDNPLGLKKQQVR